jgi:hypothetical protein
VANTVSKKLGSRTAALGELYSAVVRVFAAADPEKQNAIQDLLRQELANSPTGAALLGSAEAYSFGESFIDEDSDENETEEDEPDGTDDYQLEENHEPTYESSQAFTPETKAEIE